MQCSSETAQPEPEYSSIIDSAKEAWLVRATLQGTEFKADRRKLTLASAQHRANILARMAHISTLKLGKLGGTSG